MTTRDSRSTFDSGLDPRFSVPLRGIAVDSETRCSHYDGPEDVIAIRFPCCDVYYPCFKCHREITDHSPARWPRDEWHEQVILCGRCDATLEIARYLDHPHECPECGAAFNPNCAAHHDHYFALD